MYCACFLAVFSPPVYTLPFLFFFFLDPKTASETETDICAEWEIKTITSALKTYLR